MHCNAFFDIPRHSHRQSDVIIGLVNFGHVECFSEDRGWIGWRANGRFEAGPIGPQPRGGAFTTKNVIHAVELNEL